MIRCCRNAGVCLILALAGATCAGAAATASNDDAKIGEKLYCLRAECFGRRVSERDVKGLGLPYPPYRAADFFAEPKLAELAETARDGRLDRVDRLIAEGIKVNWQGKKGVTALIYCMSGKTLKGFERLLERGADPNLAMDEGDSATSIAAQHSPSDALKIVLAHGGNPNLQVHLDAVHREPFITLMGLVVSTGGDNEENVRLLIKAGADVNAKDSRGMTPLMHAAQADSFDAMYALLEAGADFRAKLPKHLGADRTVADLFFSRVIHLLTSVPPRDEATARKRWPKCVAFLKENGVDFAKSNFADLKMLELRADILNTDARLTPSDAAILGLTYPPYRAGDFFADARVAQLAEAAREGQAERIDKLLLGQGGNVNGCGNDGLRPVMYALAAKDTRGLRRLLEKLADPNRQNDFGDSAVSLAARRKGSEALKVILAMGGNPNLPSPAEPTPLYDAITNRNLENVRVLIKAGADVNALRRAGDSVGGTPVVWAAYLGAYEILCELLAAGADFRLAQGELLYHMFSQQQGRLTDAQAAQRNKCIEFLEKNGVDLTKQKQQWSDFDRRRIEQQEPLERQKERGEDQKKVDR